jgi:hypothetical protein
VTTQVVCTGTWHGEWTSCTPNHCPQPNVACCFPDESCSDLTAAACTAQGGTPQPYPSSCSPANPCLQARGACCFPAYTCAITTEATCLGDWLGANTTCDLCPRPPTGACCIGHTGACETLTAQACAEAGGRFKGAGTPCGLATCACKGDCNCDGVVNFDDIDPFVLALSDPDGYQVEHPGCDRMFVADCNGDGVVNFDDIDPFVAILSSAPECP